MNFKKRLDYMAQTEKKITDADGAANAKLASAGKSTGIERMKMLFDEGTFVEIGAYVRRRVTELDAVLGTGEYEGVVTGYGSVDGILVFAYAQDFSKQSGALSEACVKKIVALYEMAEKNGSPIVSVFDSAGVKIEEGMDALAGYGAIMSKASSLSGIIPQISVIAGICSGGAAVCASLADFVVMEKKNGKLYMTAPFVLKNSIGEKVPADFGGAASALKTGAAALAAEGEAAVFAQVKKLLQYLPANNTENAFCPNANDDNDRLNDRIADMLETEYDSRELIKEIADNGEFMEVYAEYPSDMICGFISLSCMSAGIVANQHNSETGTMCPGAIDKAVRFINFCDSFNIPVITLADVKGFDMSVAAEQSQFALYGAKLAAAYAGATVPKITLIAGSAIGTAFTVMGSKQLGADVVFAYPTSVVSIMSADTAVNFLYSEKISKSADPVAEREKLLEQWEVEVSSPVNAASGGQIDQILKPEQTRQKILSALFVLQNKKVEKPFKKHSSMSL